MSLIMELYDLFYAISIRLKMQMQSIYGANMKKMDKETKIRVLYGGTLLNAVCNLVQ